MDNSGKRSVIRFMLPVALETLGSVLIGMVFSSLIGNISKSALAAISTANIVVNFYASALSLLSVGAAVLTARMIGARENAEASRTIEQSLLLTLIFSLTLTLLSLTLAHPIMKLIMPTVEAQLLGEAVTYFRVNSISLPFLFLYTMLITVLRASGNSRAPFFITITQSLVQVIVAYLFINLIPLDVIGAGLSMVVSRIVGAALSLIVVLRTHSVFFVQPRNILKPNKSIIKRLIRLGVPASIESCFVQFGYLLANSLTMGLGTHQAAVYSIANTLQTFANTPQTINSVLCTSFVGQYLGAKDTRSAKRFGYKVLAIGLPACVGLYLVTCLLTPTLAALYTSDAAIASSVGTCMWILILYAPPAVSINTVDPSLRAGGDVKFVLAETLVGVWLVRLPLSWLLAYHFKQGVYGIYIANIVSLYVRAGCGLFRYVSGKWMYKRV